MLNIALFGPPGAGPEGRGPEGRGPEGRGPEGEGERRGPGGFGGPPNPEQMVERLMEMDRNGDGKLTKEEAGERMAPLFERADTNGDGELTREEIATRLSATSGRPGAGPGVGGPGPGAPGANPGGPGFGGPEAFIDRLFQLDANEDGLLSREELSRIGEIMGNRRPEGRPEGRRGEEGAEREGRPFGPGGRDRD